MSRTDLLSPRYTLTKIPSTLFSNYCCHGHPLSPKMEDRPCDHVGRQLAGHKQALRDQMGCSQEDSDPRKKLAAPFLQKRKLLVCSRVFLSHQASPFQNDRMFATSIVWLKQLERRLQRQCRLTKTDMRSALIW